MSSLLSQLQALRSPPELRASRNEELDHHITSNVLPFLNSIPPQVLAHGESKAAQDHLEELDPCVDTLPYLYVLLAQIDAVASGLKNQTIAKILQPGGLLWQRLDAFISGFNGIEIRYAGTKWVELIGALDGLASYGNGRAAVVLMGKAMIRLDPTNGTFTTTHTLFLRHCLRTRSFFEAQVILSREYHSFPTQDAPLGTSPCSAHHQSNAFITVRSRLTGKVRLDHALEYHLLGAMAYIGLNEWAQACHHLEYVLSTPTNNIAHASVLEAYRKWVLVQLILNGKVSPLPNTASPATMKTIKAATRPYEAIAEAFSHDGSTKLHCEAFEAQSVFSEDGNFGLIRHVLDRHRELSVIRLAKIYAAVSLDMLAGKLNMSPEAAQPYISSLIDRGLLDACIEQNLSSEGQIVIKFFEDLSKDIFIKPEGKLLSEMTTQSARIQSLAHDVNEADRKLGLANEYLEHVRRSRKAIGQDRSSPEQEGMDMSFAAGLISDDDENVMEDVN